VGGFEGAFGIGPQYAAYPVETAPPVHPHRVRNSYRHVHSHYSHG
jgi:hypothetical protein